MADPHLSIRLNAATLARLDAESRRSGQSRSELARTLLEEGLRTGAHPGIVFRFGPAGRRPGLSDGPDVWEVARVFTGLNETGEKLIEATCRLTGLNARQVRTALRYYAEHRDEIDEWIRLVDEEANRAEAAWEREQALLQS